MPARIKVEGVSMKTPLTQTVASQRPNATMQARIRNPSMLRTPLTRRSCEHTKEPSAD